MSGSLKGFSLVPNAPLALWGTGRRGSSPARLLVLGHVACPVGGRLHGVHDGGPQRALLQLVQRVDGGAPRRADVSSQLRRVLPRLQHHLRCTLWETRVGQREGDPPNLPSPCPGVGWQHPPIAHTPAAGDKALKHLSHCHALRCLLVASSSVSRGETEAGHHPAPPPSLCHPARCHRAQGSDGDRVPEPGGSCGAGERGAMLGVPE